MNDSRIERYLKNMKEIQEIFLAYLDEFYEANDFYNNITTNHQIIKYKTDKDKFCSILILLVKISNNYHRTPDFFTKIDRILDFFKNDIKQTFSNTEIFQIFKSNKRLLFYIIKEDIIIVDKNIAQKIYNIESYHEYFYPEIKNFINEKQREEILKKLDENWEEEFDKKRKEGENDEFICKLIRNDSVEEFIALYNKLNYSPNKEIKKSIFETNDFLQYSFNTLVEYSAFFGSFEIFAFLYMNGVELAPSIWLYAIHGKNSSLIHFLEENQIEPKSYSECFFESMKCHHNDLANYFLINQLNDEVPKEFIKEDKKKYFGGFYRTKINSFLKFFEYYNFAYITTDVDIQLAFWCSCKFNYLFIAKTLLENQKININEPFIYSRYEDNYEHKIWYKNTPFNAAIENENLEIVKLLASNENIKVNCPDISIIFLNIISNF